MEGEEVAHELTLAIALDVVVVKEGVALVESSHLDEVTRGEAKDNLVGLAEESEDDSENLDIEEDINGIQPMKPSHVNFGKSKIMS